MSTENEKKRGRPAGGVSLVKVKMSELKSVYGDNDEVVVGRVEWEKAQVRDFVSTAAPTEANFLEGVPVESSTPRVIEGVTFVE